MSKFYRVLVDARDTDRWYLKMPVDFNGREIDPRIFTSCARYSGLQPLKLPLRRDGKPIDFNFCDFDMVVTRVALNKILQELVGSLIQRVPIEIDNSDEPFEILNVLDEVKCVSESMSEFTKWTQADVRPDKIGQFRMITKLVIDPDKAIGHKIFRVNEWKIALIVDEEVKQLLESAKVTGIVFQSVT